MDLVNFEPKVIGYESFVVRRNLAGLLFQIFFES
jgi:hypothetical protein